MSNQGYQSGGGYGGYPSSDERIQTARSRMLGGSDMSSIMGASGGGGGRQQDSYQQSPYGQQQQQQRGNPVSAPSPSTGQSTKSQYALELEQQMREKKAREQRARELDDDARGGGRQSRLVTQLRGTVQDSRVTSTTTDEEAADINVARRRMLGGGAMAGMLGGGGGSTTTTSSARDRDDRGPATSTGRGSTGASGGSPRNSFAAAGAGALSFLHAHSQGCLRASV
jgi:hypothetical protein